MKNRIKRDFSELYVEKNAAQLYKITISSEKKKAREIRACAYSFSSFAAFSNFCFFLSLFLKMISLEKT